MTRIKQKLFGPLGVPGLVVLAVVSLLLGSAAVALVQGPAENRLPTARVALINAGLLYSESQIGKRCAARIAELDKQLQTMQQSKEAAAAERRAAIAALRSAPDPSGDKAMAARRQERELEAFIEDGTAEFRQQEQRAQQQTQTLHQEYQREMRPFIEAVAREKGLDFLVDAAIAFQMNPAFDISKEVVARADAAQKSGPPRK